MNKINKALVAMLLLSSMAPLFAHASPPTATEVVNCFKLEEIANSHSKLSVAVKRISSNNKKFTTTQLYKLSKASLNKIYDDINEVRKLAGITDEVDLLDQTESLLNRVEARTISDERSTEIMLDKLPELDDEMFETIRDASEKISGCHVSERRSRAAAEESSDLVQ